MLPASAATLTADPGKINVRSIPAVKNAVRKIIAAGKVPPNWTGNIDAGNAGTVSPAYHLAILKSVNLFRALAGLKPVVFDSALSDKCKQAALMMSANQTLNHFPPQSFRFYTTDGDEAAGNSNLFLGLAGANTVPGYIEDSGVGNEIVGHRRWILWSQSQVMGSGDVLGSGQFPPANALWVLPSTVSPLPSTRRGFVAWPYEGSIPNTLVFRRWSFGVPSADFSNATVKVKLKNKNVPVTIVDRTSNGFGDNTIVFQPSGVFTAGSFLSHLVAPKRPITYVVTVGNVGLITGSKKTFRYRVKVFPM